MQASLRFVVTATGCEQRWRTSTQICAVDGEMQSIARCNGVDNELEISRIRSTVAVGFELENRSYDAKFNLVHLPSFAFAGYILVNDPFCS